GAWANSAGSKVAPSRLNIAGRRDATSGLPRSRPSSSSAKSTLSSPTRLSRLSRQRRRHRLSRSCSGWRRTRAVLAWAQPWAGRARPGGNVTGLSVQTTELAAKRLELLRQVVPGLQRLAAIGHYGGPGVVLEIGELQTAARSLGLDVAIFEVRRAEDFASAFAAFKGRVDAVYVVSDPLMTSNRVRLNTLSLVERLPPMHGLPAYVDVGALM